MDGLNKYNDNMIIILNFCGILKHGFISIPTNVRRYTYRIIVNISCMEYDNYPLRGGLQCGILLTTTDDVIK